MQTPQDVQPAKKRPAVKSEDVFKIVSFILVIVWSSCIKYFFKFREYLKDNELFYF